MDNNNLASKVNIDGNAIRRIREANKLTQLYVAKVVGVTTDTVSRWENNRYPSIRRDNALLLAEALEVELDDILLDDNGDPHTSAVSNARRKFYFGLAAFFIFVFVGLGTYLYFMQRNPAAFDFSVSRVLPSFAVPGGTLPVRIRLDTSGEMKGMILRERFPEGWKLNQASPPPSSLDNVDGIVRWIIKPDTQPAVISYLLHVPIDLEENEQFTFSGEVIINPRGSGVTYSINGNRLVKAGAYHWADDNGDFVIDDGETLDASNSIDEMEGLHLSWETIEKIWDAGRYKWDAEQKRFIPVEK